MVKVSVIIPTYKRSEVICRAVDSVLAQTLDSIEVLVVDDNGIGTINTVEMARFDIFSTKRTGMVRQRGIPGSKRLAGNTYRFWMMTIFTVPNACGRWWIRWIRWIAVGAPATPAMSRT